VEISRYGIYRSIVGFEANNVAPSVVSGKTLSLSLNLGPMQTVTFDASTPVVDKMNGFFVGGAAVVSQVDNTRFLFRIDGGSSPGVVQVVGGTAMADLGLTAGTYSYQSKDYLIRYLNAQPNDDVNGVEYCDPDGTLYDSYRVTTVNLSNEESAKTAYVTPTGTTGKLCTVYGCVTNIAGVRIPDATVSVRILEMPQTVVPPSYINEEVIEVLSDPQGRFEVAVLQGSHVEIAIPSIYYNRKVYIPMQNRVSISELPVDRDYRYPLETEV
jgi:hypothetical protein